MARVVVPLALLGASGCFASVAFKPGVATPGPGARVLPGVPVRSFGVQSCGAGSLSAVLNYYGDPVELGALDASLPKARHGGVLTLDMVLAARGRGFDARLVEGSPELVEAELVAGRPVILMLQLTQAPGAGGDLFHYVVLDGVDAGRDLVRLQWGDEKPVWTRLATIDAPWRLTKRATLLVTPSAAPEAKVAGGGSPQSLRYAVALEEAGRTDEAIALYRRLADQQPDSALVWTNLANAEARRGRTVEAEVAYRQALALDPQSGDALNNLAWLLLEEGDLAEAEALAQRAVARGGEDAYLALDTLGRIQRAAGRCSEAVATLRTAEQQAPAQAAGRDGLVLELGLAERDCADAAWRARLEALLAVSADEEVRRRTREALQGAGTSAGGGA